MSFVTASRVYHPGHLIYTEHPFARVLPSSKRNKQCEYCCKRSDLIACSECSIIKYCGLECQAKDSSDHGIECENLAKIERNFHHDLIRLLGRIIFKIKDKDWNTITRNVMGTDVSFEDIDPHYEEMINNPMWMLIYKGIRKPLKEFIGEENMPEEENLIKIMGKVKFSFGNFGISFPNEFFFGASRFQHECIPNSNLDVHRNVLKVWALKKIPMSEKITVSFRTILTSYLIRSPVNENCLDICRCTECSLPYGESVLTKILDEERAYEVIKFSERIIQMGQVMNKADLEKNPLLKLLLDKALEMNEGVLGHTNALHLKLIALKITTLDDNDVQKKMYLIELEKHMSAAFGEFYIELHDIYEALIAFCINQGSDIRSSNLLESAFYLKKLKPLQMHRSNED